MIPTEAFSITEQFVTTPRQTMVMPDRALWITLTRSTCAICPLPKPTTIPSPPAPRIVPFLTDRLCAGLEIPAPNPLTVHDRVEPVPVQTVGPMIENPFRSIETS